jgi:hypothetical protein
LVCKDEIVGFSFRTGTACRCSSSNVRLHYDSTMGYGIDVDEIDRMGKGFQRVMKRWGYSGGTASHGNSLAHRTPGTTGQHQVRFIQSSTLSSPLVLHSSSTTIFSYNRSKFELTSTPRILDAFGQGRRCPVAWVGNGGRCRIFTL